ncbi:MAG TPA: hypothetical protein VE136_11135 [Anaerolineales bacterium]|jgi:ABC-type amino acid transport system permease subunit|nr:hypothetical protein [Anaerolineales bacterium]
MTNRVINLLAFAVLTLLWVGFIAALLFNREMLDVAWQSFRGWPLLVQIVVGLLVLPVTLGLWIWETSWPLIVRLILVIGLAWVTGYTFFPRKSGPQTGTTPVEP